MKKIVLVLLFACLPLSLFAQEIVEKIEILGNERITRETILYYLSSREGDHFNEDLLRRDFRVLWSTGFFSNIKIEKENGATGRVIKITVEENPVIKDIVYKTGKKLKEDDIVKKLKEKDVYLLPYSYYSPYKIQKIEGTIKELLLEKGLTTGTVEIEENKKGSNELEIVFSIDEGPKIKVGEIYFKGKPMLRKGILMSGIKENKKHNLYSWVAGKDNFKESLLPDDL
ncbi:MAG: outer membrane protein assembly factor BamA, partial [Candidatus Aminicenantes bacterium]